MRLLTMNLPKLTARIRKMTNENKLMHLEYILEAIGRNAAFRRQFEEEAEYVVRNREDLLDIVRSKLGEIR